MIETTRALFVLAAIAVASLDVTCRADVIFDFVESGSGDVIARLELDQLPASPVDVGTISFTAAGQAFFGIGPKLTASYEAFPPGSPSQFVSVNSGLQGSPSTADGVTVNTATFITDEAPDVLLGQPLIFNEFSIFVSDVAGDDRIELFQADNDDFIFRELNGNFVAVSVPEPSAVAVLPILALGLASRRRRRSMERARFVG